jgi:uncharacterized protein with HEPN domain
MNDRTESLLEHMLEDAEDVILFAARAKSYDAFVQDKMIRKAITMSLLNIGELANHLPNEYKVAHPEIPWKNMTGLRNYAAHGYHNII